MSHSLRVAVCQVNPTVGDIDGNMTMIRDWTRRAVGHGARLIAFPELVLTGYPPEDLLLNRGFVSASEQALRELASEARDEILLIGAPEAAGDALHNTLAVLHDGDIVARYRKCRLPNYGVFDELRHFTPGEGGAVIEVDGIPIGLSICEDIWFPGSPTSDCVSAGARMIINASASPFHAGKGDERARMLADRSREHGVPVAYCALVGGQDELVFDGDSITVGADGAIVARARSFQEDLLLIDVSSEGSKITVAPVEGGPIAPPEPIEQVRRALGLGLADYVTKNGFPGVVLGVSGGIDSAVAAAVAVDALGCDRVTGVVMPSPWSSDETQSDARALCEALGIRCLEFRIESLMRGYAETLGEQADGPGKGLAEENIQARIRGNLLMSLSNSHGWLVLTTGNKSELAVGYSTLYGDAAGGFGLLKDVPKTTVYELAQLYGSQPDGPIPSAIVERPPSAELRPGQRDDESLPPYDILDPIIRLHVEEGLGSEEIATHGFDPETTRRVLALIDRSEYKRRQYPPGVKITPLAFGRDRRMPMTNAFRA